MFGLFKKMFVILMTGILSASNFKKYILSNQNCIKQPALINLHPNT